MEPFSIKDSFRFGWNKTKQYFWFVVSVMFVNELIHGLGRMFGDSRLRNVGMGDAVLSFGFWVLSIVVMIGLMKVFLALSRNEGAHFMDIFKQYGVFWKFVGVSVVYGIMSLIGFVLLIAPGVFVMIRYGFAPLLVIDKHMGIVEAIKESGRITAGHFWKLLLFWLVSCGVIALGVIALGIGILVAMPIVLFAYINVYERLSNALMPAPATVA